MAALLKVISGEIFGSAFALRKPEFGFARFERTEQVPSSVVRWHALSTGAISCAGVV